MIYDQFEEICYIQFCYCCKYNHEHCFPLCSLCPQQDNIQKLYNAYCLSHSAEEAAEALDEDDPVAVALAECFSEQEDLCDALLTRIAEAVAV